MKYSGIYKIQSQINPGRCYIGSAINFRDRWRCHLKSLRNNKHHSPQLQRHFNKYSESDLVFIIIEPCFPEFLIIREQFYIDTLKPYFNVCQIAGSTLGFLHSEKTKLKTRIKISESLMGEKNHFFRKHHTKESIKKQSEAAKQRPTDSVETRRKKSISHKGKGLGSDNPMFGFNHSGKNNPNYGKKDSIESRNKKRIATLNMSDEHRRKLSEAGKKRKHSEAELKIMSEAQKKAWIIRKQNKVA